MNINELEAKLSFIENLKQIEREITNEIVESLSISSKDSVSEILENIKEGHPQKDINDFVKKLESIECPIDKAKDNPILIPYIKYNHFGSLEIGITYPKGDKLAAYLCESDYGTYQTGSVYYDKDGYPMDISLAEIKKGDLAQCYHLPEDNRDIDVMIWENPFDEDYTKKFTLKNSDIEKALETEEIEEER